MDFLTIPEYYPQNREVTASKDHNEMLSTLMSAGELPLMEKFKKELDTGYEKIHRARIKAEHLVEQEQLKERVYQEALSSGDVETAVGIATMPPTEPTDYALERQGIDNLIIRGGANVQEAMLNSPTYTNYLKNSAVLQTFIDRKKQEEVDTQGWGDFLFDMAVGLIPFNQLTKELSQYGVSNFAEQKANEYAALMQLPPDEFEKQLPEFWARAKESAGWFNSDEGKALSELVRLNKWNSSSWLSSDNLPYLDAAGVAAMAANRVLKGPTTVLQATGNTQAAAQVTAAGVAAKVPAATHNILPGVLQAAPLPNVSIATPSGYALQAANPQFAQVATSVLARMDALYKQSDVGAVEKVLDATVTEYGKDARFNARIVDIQYDNSLPVGDADKRKVFSEKVNIYIGDNGGVPFQTVTDARQYIDNTPGLLNPSIVTDSKGDVLVRIQGRPYEAGSIQKFDLSKSPWLSSFASKLVGKKLSLPDTMFGKQLAADSTLEFARNEMETLDSIVSRLDRNQLQDLEMILKKGSVELNPQNGKTSGVWYDVAQLHGEYNNLFGRNPTAKEVDAYQAIQAKSDIAWLVRNEVTRRELAFNNFKAYKANNNTFLVKDVTEERPTVSVVDWRSSRAVPWDQDPNVKILRFSQPQKFGNHKFKHAVVDKNAVLDELPDQVVSYNPGGSRGYQGDHYLKQVNTWTDPGSGKTVVDNPRVLSVYVSKAEAEGTANKINTALDIFNKYQQGLRSYQYMESEVNRLFRGKYSAQELLTDISEGRLDPRFKVEVTKDSAVPTEQNAIVAGPDTYSMINDSTPNADILAKQGQLYFSERGDVLTKFGTAGEPVDIVSPLDMIHRSTDAALRSGAYWNYRLNAATSWFESLKASGYPINGPDALRHIMGPDIDTIANGVPRPDLEKLRQIQQHFKAVFSPTDPMDTMIAQWVMGKITKNEWEDLWIGKGFKKFAQFKPAEKMRSLMFFKTFFGDVTQFLLQGLTTAQTVAIAGPSSVGTIIRHSPSYVTGYYFDRLGRLNDYVRNNMATFAGITRAEWDENYEFIRDSGFLHIGGTHGYLDNDLLQRQVKTAFGRSLAWVGERGIAPFTRAEQYLRGNAITVAVSEFRKANPGVSLKRQDAREWIMKRADTLNVNMHRVNNADIQKGLPGVLTQFMAFQQRSLEQIFSSKVLTKSEKMRVLATQFAMHGSYGLPAGALVTQIANDYGVDPAILRESTQGMFDRFISYALETDIDSSSRYSPYGSDVATTTTKALYDWWYSQTAPEFSLGNVAPSLDAISKIYGGSLKVWNYLQAGNVPGQNTSVDWQLFKETVGSYFSSMNRTVKAALVRQEMMIRNNKGATLMQTGNSEVAEGWSAAAFLGMQPQEVHDYYLNQNKEKLSQAKFNFIADRIFELDVKVMQANGNPELIDNYTKQKANLFNTLEPHERIKMYSSLQSKYKESLFPKVDVQLQKKAVKDEVSTAGANK